jgi:hypothetical protein
MCAPILMKRGISALQALITAPPAMTMERDAYVPVENGVVPVSPCTTWMRATSMPSTSFASWASVVSMPWPCECTPTRTSSPPPAVQRTAAWS